jgi:cytochrome oxidase Cu insertion factor (SCO1/SenC/PrrC family)
MRGNPQKSNVFLDRRNGKAANDMELRIGRFLLFTFFLPLFLAATALPAKGEVNYLEQMGVHALKENIDAPQFILPDLEGRKVSLREFQGKFVMLNFWATW